MENKKREISQILNMAYENHKKGNLKLAENLYGKIFKENGWATISVVFEKTAKKRISIPSAEIIYFSDNVICYLLKEDNLSVSLRKLFEFYNNF